MFKSRTKIYLFFFLAIFPACRNASVKTTFAEICGNENFASVEIKGYLRLTETTDSGSDEKGFYKLDEDNERVAKKLILTEKQNGTGAFIYVSIDETDERKPNRIQSLPESYTYNDLHIFAADGAEIKSNQPVEVKGKIVKNENVCFLKIEKIESY